jgi:uncharacterized protein (UPF0332 family)
MKQQQIQAEWRRALKASGAAKALLDQGFPEDAVSRGYYAVMHAAKAVLLAHDTVAESHAAVRRLFGRALVKTGAVEKEWADILAREQVQRENADYNVDLEMEAEVARRMVKDAQRFLERMREYLISRGVPLEEEHQ